MKTETSASSLRELETGPASGAKQPDWCWEFMKHEGCYASHGFSTWLQNQQKVFDLGWAPDPSEERMLGVELNERGWDEVGP